MKQFFLLLFTIAFSNLTYSQKKLSIESNYGINGNFFVRSYDETSRPFVKKFYKKNFIGSIAGIELKYQTGKSSNIGLAYSRSRNSKEINFYGTVLPVAIIDYHISHINNYYMFYYERLFSKKTNGFMYHIGLVYQRGSQQEIDLGDLVNGGASFDERNYKNSRLEEGGFVFGLQYSKFIDTRFELGIKTRGYFLVSTGSFDLIVLTPAPTYHFGKGKK